MKNSTTTGVADSVIAYGNPNDTVLVGDWNGDSVDTFAVRRSNIFFVKDSISNGLADYTFAYGDFGDFVLVGDWDGNGSDTIAVRRGITYSLRNSTTSGVADVVFSYGNPNDIAFTGDWDGDSSDSIGVRRPLMPPAPTWPGGPAPASSVDCGDFSTYAAAQAWFDFYFPLYGDVAGLDSDHDGQACELLP